MTSLWIRVRVVVMFSVQSSPEHVEIVGKTLLGAASAGLVMSVWSLNSCQFYVLQYQPRWAEM